MPRGEENEVGVAMDGKDGHYPRTINEELVELGQLPDDVDNMGDAVALLFGSNAALLFGSIGLLLKRYWSSLNCSMIQLLFFSGVYYPTSPLVLHHILEIASHLHDYEHDSNLSAIVMPMKAKFLKY